MRIKLFIIANALTFKYVVSSWNAICHRLELSLSFGAANFHHLHNLTMKLKWNEYAGCCVCCHTFALMQSSTHVFSATLRSVKLISSARLLSMDVPWLLLSFDGWTQLWNINGAITNLHHPFHFRYCIDLFEYLWLILICRLCRNGITIESSRSKRPIHFQECAAHKWGSEEDVLSFLWRISIT